MPQSNLLAFALALAFTLPVAAQTVTGSLVGHISDSSNAPIPGVKILAKEISRGVSRNSETNEAGNYTISSMEPGVYQVTIEQPGFKRFVNDWVEVAINSTIRVDAQLELGQVSETVEVKASTLQIKTDRGDLSQQIQSSQVENLPLSTDRNYQSLLTLGRAPRNQLRSALHSGIQAVRWLTSRAFGLLKPPARASRTGPT